MVVIGIDFGSESCLVSSMQNLKFTTLSNDYNERKTPSFVSFDDQKREIGVAAKNQQLTNFDNTIHNFKKLLMVPKVENTGYQSFSIQHGQFEFPVSYLKGSEMIDCIQITAMLLAKLKTDADVALKPDKVTECVIAIPAYFTKSEYKSVLIAAAVAGLKCNRIIKDTTAVAVNYKHNKKFPDKTLVAFVDFGYESFQVAIWEFCDQKMKAIAEVAEMIGGRVIDELLADHFIDQIKNSPALKQNRSFCVGLLAEVEKLKKKMSVNTEELPLDIKHLLNDESIKLSMQRSRMEEICKPVLDEIEALMQKCIEQSLVEPESIHSVEIVGGSSRMPSVKDLIRKVFGKVPTATMNQDEAVSRGCFLRSVMSKRMKDFKIVEIPLKKCEAAKEGFMKIGEIHSDFRDDKNEQLNINWKNFDDRVRKEEAMKLNDENEISRRNVWNELEEFVNKESKQGGMLENIAEGFLRDKVSHIRTWKNGTKAEYCETLNYLISYVDRTREQIRTAAFTNLTRLIVENTKPGGFLDDPKLGPKMKSLLNWKDGTAEDYNNEFADWSIYIKKEKERRAARKSVHELISHEMVSGGMLNRFDLKTELNMIKNCADGTTVYYTAEFNKWSEFVEKERVRQKARERFHSFITKERMNGGLLDKNEWKESIGKLIQWKNETTEEYEKAFEKWKRISEKENERRCARKKFHDYITLEMKTGGMLDDETLAVDLTRVKSWMDLTTEQYHDKYQYWRQKVSEIYEKKRESTRSKLFDFIREHSGPEGLLCDQKIAKELNNILTWHDKHLNEYVKTFEWASQLSQVECKRRYALKQLSEFIGSNKGLLEEMHERGQIYQNLDVSSIETTEHYESELVLLKRAVEEEISRREVVDKLEAFIVHNSQTGRVLSDPKYLEGIEQTRTWLSQLRSREEYERELTKWSSVVALEDERRDARSSLQDLVATHSGTKIMLRFAGEFERLTHLHDESTEFYINQRQKWISTIESENKSREEAHKKLLDLYAQEAKENGSLFDVLDQLNFKNEEDEFTADECTAEFDKWKAHSVNNKEVQRVTAQSHLLYFIDGLHEKCLSWKHEAEIKVLRKNQNNCTSFYARKLVELKKQYDKCIAREFFSEDDISRWETQILNLVDGFEKNSGHEEISSRLNELKLLFEFQASPCKLNDKDKAKAVEKIDSIVKDAKQVLKPPYLSLSLYGKTPRERFFENIDFLEKMLDSIGKR